MDAVFDDAALHDRASALDGGWLGAAGLDPLEVFRRIYGPAVAVRGYSYSGPIRAYVASCLSTYRVFLFDTSGWNASGQTALGRRRLIMETVARSDEGMSLLALAGAFAEPGYLERRSCGGETPGDRFVLVLVKEWFESRLAVGDRWAVESAAAFAVLQGAGRVAEYLPVALLVEGSNLA